MIISLNVTCSRHDIADLALNNNHIFSGNGGWSNWIKNSTCTASCGGGLQLYTRSCTNPPPNEIGASCVGESYYEEECNELNCICKFVRKKYINFNCKYKLKKI